MIDAVNALQFIDSMTGRLAWPLAAVLLGLVFRRPLTELLDRIRRLKWGEKEAELAVALAATQDVEEAVEEAAKPLPADSEVGSRQNRERIERLVRDAASWGFSVGKVGDRNDLPRLGIDWDDDNRPHMVVGSRPDPIFRYLLAVSAGARKNLPRFADVVSLYEQLQNTSGRPDRPDDDDGPDPVGAPT